MHFGESCSVPRTIQLQRGEEDTARANSYECLHRVLKRMKCLQRFADRNDRVVESHVSERSIQVSDCDLRVAVIGYGPAESGHVASITVSYVPSFGRQTRSHPVPLKAEEEISATWQ